MLSLIESVNETPSSFDELSAAYHHPFWYAIYTRSRHEQLVKKQLDGRGIENFLPQYEKVSQWRDRKKQIRLPLFPGYLFVKILLQDRVEVLKTFGAVCVVGNGCTPMPIPDEQIVTIQAFIEKGLKCDPYPYLKVGNRIRISDGPLSGMEGILVRKKNQTRLILSIDLIQRSVAIEIDSWKIERI